MNKDLIISILVAYIVFDLTSAILYYKNNPHIADIFANTISTQDIIIALIIAIIVGFMVYNIL